MERARHVFGDPHYARLALISVAHLYNLRKQAGYTRCRQHWTKTRPVTVPIGQRRAPAPNNQPGYLRVDSVHQGDQDGVKGRLNRARATMFKTIYNRSRSAA